MTILVVDLGGTHARFSLAKMVENRVEILNEPIIVSTNSFDSLQSAWQSVRDRLNSLNSGIELTHAVIAVASPVSNDFITLTNYNWQFSQSKLAPELRLDSCQLINDFAAVAHAIPHLLPDEHPPIGPELTKPIDANSFVTIIGMGTGIGVAHRHNGRVIATEGGHTGFAARNEREDRLLGRLRPHFGRVSIERIISGIGLSHLITELNQPLGNDKTLPTEFTPEQNRAHWQAALAASDPIAIEALDWYCELAGTYAGDIALVSGAPTVLIGGGLGLRLKDILPKSQFMRCFRDKGRMTGLVEQVSVQIITHPQPGLLGAAAVGLIIEDSKK